MPVRGEVRVGRDPDCELYLDNPAVSRHHATLLREGGEWVVVDQGSANGTFVNGSRIGRQVLHPGDLIAFGTAAEFSFGLERAGDRTFHFPSPLSLQLIARAPEGGRRRHLLGRRLTVIGRAATADVVLPVGQVSAVHARIDRRAGRLVVSDLGSLNGTFLNGQPVKEAPLKPGDRLAFADREFDVRLAPVPSFAGLIGLGVIALVIAGWLLAPSLATRQEHAGKLWTRDMYLEQARRSLVAAVRAYDKGGARELQLARSEFNTAIRALAAADRLFADQASEAEVAAALREVAGDLGGRLAGRDIYALYAGVDDRLAALEDEVRSAARRRLEELAQQAAVSGDAAGGQTGADTVTALGSSGAEGGTDRAGDAAGDAVAGADAAWPADELGAQGRRTPDLREELGWILADFGIDIAENPIPSGLLTRIERSLAYWTGSQRAYTERALDRSRPYLSMIKRELARQNLPLALGYLPFVESGYRRDVESPAQARGMWQFMPGTARMYGLRVDNVVDERTDVDKSTIAACRYIRGLLATFGPDNFLCAVAAYNKGHYGMVNCLLQVDPYSKWKFWDVVELGGGCFKEETIEYVPRFLAAALIMENPEAYGFTN